jgi:hypothetical protein
MIQFFSRTSCNLGKKPPKFSAKTFFKIIASVSGLSRTNLIRNELNDEREEFEVRFGFFWRENDDSRQKVEEDEEADQVRPDVHRLVVKPKPTGRRSSIF